MPLFSIIIPLFNKAAHIENTLNSVLEQSFTDYEIIVVNDGSTDGSERIISAYNDSRIKLYNQENAGVSAARNLGIAKATGKLIAFLDADDYWFPNHLDALHELYQNFPDCGIYCSRYKIKTTEKHFQIPKYNGISDTYIGIVANYFYSNRPFRMTTSSNIAIPAGLLKEIGGFTVGVTNGQDLELWTKIAIQKTIAIGNKCTCVYNFHIPGSLAKSNVKKMNLMDFSQFKNEEDQNSDLKSYLDIHRFYYAMLYKSNREFKKAKFYYDDIDKKNIGMVNQLLYNLPSWFLPQLYRIKKALKKIGIEFSTYN